MTTPDRTALLDAGRAYLERWSAWLKAHPDADERLVQEAMQRGDPPPEDKTDVGETAVSQWADTHPAAYRIYWSIRNELLEQDGKKRAHHHRVAMMCIHDAFPSKPERARLGLPSTVLELAALLGVSDRVMRRYRHKYPAVFSATTQTMRDTFLDVYYGRSLEAMGETAATVGREGNADRALLFKMRGDLTDNINLTVDVSNLSDEELEQLDRKL